MCWTWTIHWFSVVDLEKWEFFYNYPCAFLVLAKLVRTMMQIWGLVLVVVRPYLANSVCKSCTCIITIRLISYILISTFCKNPGNLISVNTCSWTHSVISPSLPISPSCAQNISTFMKRPNDWWYGNTNSNTVIV